MMPRKSVTSRVLNGGLHRISFVGALVTTVLLGTVGQGYAAPRGGGVDLTPPKVAAVKAAKKVHSLPIRRHAVTDAASKPYRADRKTWPVARTVTVAPKAGATTTAAGTPIRLKAVGATGTGPVTVASVDHATAAKAGIHGTIFTLSAKAAGEVAVTADYNGFAEAEGGNFASRLHLVALPPCVLTTPAARACQAQTGVASKNDTARSTVAGAVTLTAGTTKVLALSTADTTTAVKTVAAGAAAATPADGGAPGGSYQATSLSPTGSWAQGGSSGSFTYSYPIAVPPSRSQLRPDLSLSYDSASVDGKTSSSQAQAGWAGDGWSTPSSFIEWTYASCSDNPEGSAAPTKTSDLCYDGPIVTMSLNGGSSELVRDDTTGQWRPRFDDGSVVTQTTKSDIANSTYDNDYWKVTTRDGSTYYFGLNHLPGWASGKTATNSVQTVPVFSAHKGDPCFQRSAATWAGSVCTMGYRWNLDYVTDVRGNAMSYYYAKDTNFYGQNLGATMVKYDRDSYLKEIQYGFTDGQAYGNVPDKVVFATGPRCFTGTCTSLTSSTAANFPDVPFDAICASGAKCTAQSPAFFSTVRLTSITAQQYDTTAATPGYQAVDTYALTETIPSAKTGDSAAPTLWLSKITRTGSDQRAGGSKTAITMPSVGFTAIALQNRVDTTTVVLPPLYRNRISAITTETGGVIGIDYGLPKPCTTASKPAAATNTKSCFPVRWTPAGSATVDDWFNRYAVTGVTEYDATGGAVAKATSYSYGDPAWHYDDNEVVKKKYRSYGQFHGYATVTTYTGDGVNDVKTKHVTSYYQGMSQNNSTAVRNVTDSQGGAHEDKNELQGKVLEDTAYQGDGGPIDASTVTSYWVSASSATRSRTTAGLPALEAKVVAPALTWTRQRVTSGSPVTWRVTAADTSYDSTVTSSTYGLARYAYMHTVPVDPDYDSCTVTSYAPINVDKNLAGLASQTETDSVACANYTAGSPTTVPADLNGLTSPAAVKRPDQVKSATRTFYDGATSLTAVPSKGQATTVEEAVDYADGAFVWQLKGKTGYDPYGRIVSATDGNNYTTTTEYTDDAYGLVTAVKVTNPLNQSAIQTMDPARGQVLTSTDANQVKATVEFDTLGRVTGAWTESRDPATTPNYSFVYNVSQTGVTYVTSRKMNSTGGFIVSAKLYDSLLRERQTQSPTPKGGRVVADTFYDSRGWVKARNNRWWDSATTPNGAIVSSDTLAAAVPSGDRYYYDGLGRVIADESTNNGQVVSTTHTVYSGDRSTAFPAQAGDHTRAFPADTAGGTIETTLTDPIGRTTELRQYTSAPTVTAPGNSFTGTYGISGGTYTTTKYGFDGHGQQSSVTDDAGNTWTTTYDLTGQAVGKTDPVAGGSTSRYDGAGNLIQVTDALQHTTSYAYDKINRKTDQWSAPVDGRTDADKTGHWEYDSASLTYGIGHLASTTTYVGGVTGSAYVSASTNFNIFGESLGETVTIPAAEGALAGTYNYTHQYGDLTGLKIRDTYPAVPAAGLPKETLTSTYSGFLDLPDALTGLESDTSYDAYGRVDQATLGAGNNVAFVTNIYDDHTDDVTSRSVQRASTAAQRNVETHTYQYDVLGRITSETQSRLGATDTAETRCYQYDLVQRLTAAWTATDQCAATPSSSSHGTVGDPLDAKAAYWTTWAYDAIGRRTNQTQHAIGATDTEAGTDYAYTSAKQPLVLTEATTATATPQADGGTKTVTTGTEYTHDALGNLKTRTGTDFGDQTLDWTDDGKLASVASTTKGTSTFTYNADGGLVSQHDPGSSTLYLPDGQLTLKSGTVTGVRYYSLPGGDTAHRTGSGTAYGFDLTDQHGTVELALDSTAQNPTWRAFTPFGETRGESATWYDNRTFLNKPADDTTGFVNIGDRYYDPTTGAFISLDPVLEPDDPQQLSGYAYAGNNPIVNSDPTGRSVYRDPAETRTTPVTTTDTGTSTSDGTSNGGNGNGSTQGNDGSTGQAHTKKKHWYERGWDWVVDNKNTLAGVAVGFGTFALCEGASVGVGTIGCMAAAGAAGKLTTDYLNGDIHNAGDAIKSTVEGGVEGVLAVPLAAVDLVHQGSAIVHDVKEGDYAGAVGHGILAGLDAATVVGGVKAARGCPNSFVPGTLVLLADGTRKAIEKLTLQDQVAAADPTTGDRQAEPVVALIKGQGQKQLVELTLDTDNDGKPDAKLTATTNHPVWNDDSHTWVEAGSLQPGAHLLTPEGRHVTLRALHYSSRQATVYNLTVNALHTYYVLAGTTPVLVHNCGPSIQGMYESATKGRGSSAAARSYDKHMNRPNTSLFPVSSGRDRADLSEHLVGDLLTNPKAARQSFTTDEGVDVIDVWLPDIGARWTQNGKFVGFREVPDMRKGRS